ncbi:MAG: hypothetical protein AAF547_25355 [Actinomycetota bacterium]
MSFGPTVLRRRSVRVLAVVAAVVAVAFGVLALLLDRWMAGAAMAIAGVSLLAMIWHLVQSRRSAVLIDTNQFIVKDGGRQERFDRAEIDSIDLSRLRGQVRFKDGSSVTLPLDGDELIEAGLLLSPTRPTP